jgi:predicted nucleotidyltransferase
MKVISNLANELTLLIREGQTVESDIDLVVEF